MSSKARLAFDFHPRCFRRFGDCPDSIAHGDRCALVISMVMSMVCIGIMRVRVLQRVVAMPMVVSAGDGFGMLVLMMFVMDVLMFMLQRLMGMFMLMVLGEVQPYARAH